MWTMKFSHTGEYLATAGQDRIVRVWALDREDGARNILKPEPFREYAGHKGDILDLCWSHTDWLLSSSMDKTVRLWYMTMDECLRIFSHQDFVTAIAFNPVNDKYFLSGSLDGKLRFWNIPDHRVADWVDIGEMVTAASFNSDGSTAVAGSYKGRCHFYRMDGVRFDYITHLDVRNTKSNKASGRKSRDCRGCRATITSFWSRPTTPASGCTTDTPSRASTRATRTTTRRFARRFRPAPSSSCAAPRTSTCTSGPPSTLSCRRSTRYTGYRRDKHSSYEQFAAQQDIATVALFAPDKVRQSRTGDAATAVAAARRRPRRSCNRPRRPRRSSTGTSPELHARLEAVQRGHDALS